MVLCQRRLEGMTRIVVCILLRPFFREKRYSNSVLAFSFHGQNTENLQRPQDRQASKELAGSCRQARWFVRCLSVRCSVEVRLGPTQGRIPIPST